MRVEFIMGARESCGSIKKNSRTKSIGCCRGRKRREDSRSDSVDEVEDYENDDVDVCWS